MDVEFHSDSEKAQHVAVEADRYVQCDSSEAQPQPDFFSDSTTTTTTAAIALHNTNAPSNGIHAPQHDPCTITKNPIASTTTSHTSSWTSLFSSHSLMIKILGHGSVLVGLIEDSARRDENGVEVM